MTLDLEPAATEMSALVQAVPQDGLDGPTPCPRYTVAALLDHIDRLVVAFAAAATKDSGPAASGDGAGRADRLHPDWRTRIPENLLVLTAAWRDPAAYDGTTKAGGIEMSGEEAGTVALEELVVHGWDLAAALGRPYRIDEASLGVAHGFYSSFPPADPATPADPDATGFGPPQPVPDGAPLLDRVVALSGRDPGWKQPG